MENSIIQNSRRIDEINFEIDYHIIEHFSKHLYSSPYKAIEELVVNGYDAGADMVHVFLPGALTNKILVWDNGLSMNIEGLKKLWKVADSPKNTIPDRILNISNGEKRKIIGKFGIGKIASYTLGNTISHFCKIDNTYLLVNIDYGELMKKEEFSSEITINNPEAIAKKEELSEKPQLINKKEYKSPIIQIEEADAKQFFLSLFNKDNQSDQVELFNCQSWTMAIIDNLKQTNFITAGRLGWILGNGMPIQPNFKVYVNDSPVLRSLLKNGIHIDWGLGQPEVVKQISSKWDDALKKGTVSGNLKFGSEVSLNPEDPSENIFYVDFPNIGRVWGRLRLYSKSLLSDRSNENGRSHGFFIMVRNRLINAKDDKVLLNDPSFATFYSSQIILHIDGLDKELLADRERVQEDSIMSNELAVLQRATYLSLVGQQNLVFENLAKEASFQFRLPTGSPEYFMQPLAALWLNEGSGESLGFDFKDPKIEAQPLGESKFISDFSAKEGFKINSSHPYYKNLSNLLGNSKHSQKIVKEFEVIAISEQLFQGYLLELGILKHQVDDIMLWRDEMYRQIAKKDSKNLNQLAATLVEASYKSGVIFENAVVEVLKEIGFIAERDGSPGKKDVYVKAYCGDGSYKLIFESKGCSSDKGLPNDDAETGGANSHRKEAGADHAVIITRRFAGFDKEKEAGAAIINECKAMGTVSIMEVEALNKIMFAVKEYSYSLDTLKEVFTTIETPSAKMTRIENLITPSANFDFARLLSQIWEYQGETGDGDLVSCKHIWQQYEYKKNGLDFESDFLSKLEALRTIAFPLVKYSHKDKEVALTQSPENILSSIRAKFLM